MGEGVGGWVGGWVGWWVGWWVSEWVGGSVGGFAYCMGEWVCEQASERVSACVTQACGQSKCHTDRCHPFLFCSCRLRQVNCQHNQSDSSAHL